MRMRLIPILVTMAVTAALTGCGGDADQTTTADSGGDAAAGAKAEQDTPAPTPGREADDRDQAHEGHDTGDETGAEKNADKGTEGNAEDGDQGTGEGTGSDAREQTPEALNFTSTTINGKPFDGATLAGKPAVLWFWAAWCPTCRGAAPSFNDIVERFGGKVHFVGVAGKSESAEMREFVADFGLSGIPHLAGEADGLWTRFEITYQHQYAVLDRNGEIVHSGALSDEELTHTLNDLAG